MKNAYKNLRECVLTNPGGLSFLPKKVRNLALSYIPYSTGIEIECSPKEGIDIYGVYDNCDLRVAITKLNLLDYDLTRYEQSFRLRQGERGLLELEKITNILKEYFLLNPGSGIHYHVDITDIAKYIDFEMYNYETGKWNRADEFDWILKELNEWEYTGNFNKRMIGTAKNAWVRMCKTYQTIEFRIGEMTFDYQLIVKRILHCQSIVRRFKKQIIEEKKTLQTISSNIPPQFTGSIPTQELSDDDIERMLLQMRGTEICQSH